MFGLKSVLISPIRLVPYDHTKLSERTSTVDWFSVYRETGGRGDNKDIYLRDCDFENWVLNEFHKKSRT